jgi:predicted DCC family thiol-disulfide oxidoreductase YuxK
MDADVILYDGSCGLCDRTVRFVLARDRAGAFRFAALQSEYARGQLVARGRRGGALDTICVLTADGRLLERARAVAFILRRLGGVWGPLGVLLRAIPRPLADLGYRAVARVRYRIFGRVDACALPAPQARARFIA